MAARKESAATFYQLCCPTNNLSIDDMLHTDISIDGVEIQHAFSPEQGAYFIINCVVMLTINWDGKEVNFTPDNFSVQLGTTMQVGFLMQAICRKPSSPYQDSICFDVHFSHFLATYQRLFSQ